MFGIVVFGGEHRLRSNLQHSTALLRCPVGIYSDFGACYSGSGRGSDRGTDSNKQHDYVIVIYWAYPC